LFGETIEHMRLPEAERGFDGRSVDHLAVAKAGLDQSTHSLLHSFGAAHPASNSPGVERGELCIREFDDFAHELSLRRHPRTQQGSGSAERGSMTGYRVGHARIATDAR
jgi:hypothetical protein